MTRQASLWAPVLLWIVLSTAIYFLHQAMCNSLGDMEKAAVNALALTAQEKWTEAGTWIDRAIQFQPNCSRYYVYRASIHVEEKKFAQALSESDQVLKDPSLPAGWRAEALVNKAAALLGLGRTSEVEDLISQAVNLQLRDGKSPKFHPPEREFYLRRGRLNLWLKQFSAALADSTRALGLFQEAIQKKELRSTTGWTEALINRAAALIPLGKADQALTDLSEALMVQPLSQAAHYYKVVALMSLNKRAEAEAEARKFNIAEYNPNLLPYQEVAENLENAVRKNLIVKPDQLRQMSLGFDRVLADIYWLSFVQYYGDRECCQRDKYRQAPAYLYVITQLDPHFTQAYWFASFVFSADLGQPQEADKILQYGIEHNPNEWSLPYLAGFNAYLYGKDSRKAVEYYKIASSRPKAPPFLRDQIKIFESGVIDEAETRRTWQRYFKNAPNPILKEQARQKLRLLWSKTYYQAPTKVIEERALEQLKMFDVELIPKEQLPHEEDDAVPLLPVGPEPSRSIATPFRVPGQSPQRHVRSHFLVRHVHARRLRLRGRSVQHLQNHRQSRHRRSHIRRVRPRFRRDGHHRRVHIRRGRLRGRHNQVHSQSRRRPVNFRK